MMHDSSMKSSCVQRICFYTLHIHIDDAWPFNEIVICEMDSCLYITYSHRWCMTCSWSCHVCNAFMCTHYVFTWMMHDLFMKLSYVQRIHVYTLHIHIDDAWPVHEVVMCATYSCLHITYSHGMMHDLLMINSTENAAPTKCTKSTNSNFSVHIQIEPKSQFGCVQRGTKKSEALDLVDLRHAKFAVENIIHAWRMTH